MCFLASLWIRCAVVLQGTEPLRPLPMDLSGAAEGGGGAKQVGQSWKGQCGTLREFSCGCVK